MKDDILFAKVFTKLLSYPLAKIKINVYTVVDDI